MEKVSIIGLDLAKRRFQMHGAHADGGVAFRKTLSRDRVLAFLAERPRCVVAMEACGSAHHWGRAIGALGHEVRLIAPIYVKPFVRRQKNDAADAEAICEAATRPTMRYVAVKTEEQQARAMLFRTVGRTQLGKNHQSTPVFVGRGYERALDMAGARGQDFSADEAIAFAPADQPQIVRVVCVPDAEQLTCSCFLRDHIDLPTLATTKHELKRIETP